MLFYAAVKSKQMQHTGRVCMVAQEEDEPRRKCRVELQRAVYLNGSSNILVDEGLQMSFFLFAWQQ